MTLSTRSRRPHLFNNTVLSRISSLRAHIPRRPHFLEARSDPGLMAAAASSIAGTEADAVRLTANAPPSPRSIARGDIEDARAARDFLPPSPATRYLPGRRLAHPALRPRPPALFPSLVLIVDASSSCPSTTPYLPYDSASRSGYSAFHLLATRKGGRGLGLHRPAAVVVSEADYHLAPLNPSRKCAFVPDFLILTYYDLDLRTDSLCLRLAQFVKWKILPAISLIGEFSKRIASPRPHPRPLHTSPSFVLPTHHLLIVPVDDTVPAVRQRISQRIFSSRPLLAAGRSLVFELSLPSFDVPETTSALWSRPSRSCTR
ncbi:hypothetical protein C8R45DRAFT_1102158 [Mycena sanguinolenta]|nr:hypothetical protein C8R45DRAFT_1102158 [Mycena sanguinolenta]